MGDEYQTGQDPHESSTSRTQNPDNRKKIIILIGMFSDFCHIRPVPFVIWNQAPRALGDGHQASEDPHEGGLNQEDAVAQVAWPQGERSSSPPGGTRELLTQIVT